LPIFFLITPPPPTSTLFPYTTLFRSRHFRPKAVRSRSPKGPCECATGPCTQRPASCPYAAPPIPRCRRSHIDASASCGRDPQVRSEEHTSELQSLTNLVCRLLLEKKK